MYSNKIIDLRQKRAKHTLLRPAISINTTLPTLSLFSHLPFRHYFCSPKLSLEKTCVFCSPPQKDDSFVSMFVLPSSKLPKRCNDPTHENRNSTCWPLNHFKIRIRTHHVVAGFDQNWDYTMICLSQLLCLHRNYTETLRTQLYLRPPLA